MALVRINAVGNDPVLHNSPLPVARALARADRGDGPAMVMIHGFKYLPGHPRHCPHRHILALHPDDLPWRSPSWPRQLGFGTGHRDEGIAVAFGWQARGALWRAQARAVEAGQALARVIAQLRAQRPDRPVHVIAHSLGTEVALEALHHLPRGAVGRLISLSGAAFRSRAEQALATEAGRAAEFFNVTSRENDPFDFLFERLIAAPAPGDRAIGHGIAAPNALTLQLDCAGTLAHLDRLGAAIADPARRICHWSSYTRPGALQFYKELMRRPASLPLSTLQRGMPEQPARRWSRLVAPPQLPLALPFVQKAS
ncbi:esterase/lipase family protein [Pseudodonghicola flavimaris]|uniref:Alpha/beta hydrolase n=1 Tax=Pseudodonghicola flavimaris TaxID=3050036 RepID=A0ABT7EUV2_9RHOB|nr:alpha/beta hydrolase [Pseudodonghicola flavimaris]MDK3016132.1 alpha/beta hydrolase [Pseudodonghicola flavimaris]